MEQEQNEMSKQNPELEQNKQEDPVPVVVKALNIGFVGGILWSLIGAFAYYLNFSSVSAASFVLRSWIQTDWTGKWLGELISIGAIGVISIGTALVYYGLLKRMTGLLPAIVFGVGLWFLVFFLFSPVFSAVPDFNELDSNTIVTSICLFILYGTFIGYSISYEYQENNQNR